MRRFEAKYTDPPRDAVIRVMVEQGWSAPKTVRAAASGELPGVSGPFVIPLGTVYWLARRERERREEEARELRLATEPLQVRFEQVVRQLLNILLREVERLLAQAERGETDFERLRWLICCDRELRKSIPVETEYQGLSDLDHFARRLSSAASSG